MFIGGLNGYGTSSEIIVSSSFTAEYAENERGIIICEFSNLVVLISWMTIFAPPS